MKEEYDLGLAALKWAQAIERRCTTLNFFVEIGGGGVNLNPNGLVSWNYNVVKTF